MDKNLRISFEFFPPKQEGGVKKLENTIDAILEHKKKEGSEFLTFVSVTCGAGGAVADDYKGTLKYCKKLQEELQLEAMAHFTCASVDKDNVTDILNELLKNGITSILVLRGDKRKDSDGDVAFDFRNATDLLEFIKEKFPGKFKIGVATYPEGHIESENGVDDDLKYLKQKQDLGAQIAVTQLFFDNSKYYEFEKRAREMGIHIPIVPGILPVSSIQLVKRSQGFSGCTIPDDLKQLMDIEDREKFLEEGYKYTIRQCQDLIENGVTELHIYTLNNSAFPLRMVGDIKNKISQ